MELYDHMNQVLDSVEDTVEFSEEYEIESDQTYEICFEVID